MSPRPNIDQTCLVSVMGSQSLTVSVDWNRNFLHSSPEINSPDFLHCMPNDLYLSRTGSEYTYEVSLSHSEPDLLQRRLRLRRPCSLSRCRSECTTVRRSRRFVLFDLLLLRPEKVEWPDDTIKITLNVQLSPSFRDSRLPFNVRNFLKLANALHS